MDPFTFCLTLGFAGLMVMALSGLGARHLGGGHHGPGAHDIGVHGAGAHGAGAHAGAHGASAHGATAHGAHHHGTGAHHAGADDSSSAPGLGIGARAARGARQGRAMRSGVPRWLAPLLNPRQLFTLAFGFGIVGVALRGHASEWIVVTAALAGAIAFERFVIAPMWNLLERFGSRPALTLESGIMDEARAVTSFDANGQGLIALELDGQLVQVLGTLSAEERAAGVRVRAGDTLVVQDVDAKRNRCTVSRQMSTLRTIPEH
ncbi:MAG TPA: hypothetical protein VFK13_13380 [Gemmatimonadaceae bacterium]|nr:hypothetical protein [Gemmatimonadaceae bacterium]